MKVSNKIDYKQHLVTITFHAEIRMFITPDRIILLDSSPVMGSRGRKDFIIGELDDLRRIILLLNTCHVLIVMLDDNFNINFIR